MAIDALITRFFWCLDNDEIDEAARMFTADAWLDMGVANHPRVQGPDGVRALFGVRPPHRVVRHHWFGFMPLTVGDEIAACFQFATYVGSKGEAGTPTATTIGDVRISVRQDSTDGVWRLAGMERDVVFSA